MNRPIEIIKAASELGAGTPGAGAGPDRLLHTLYHIFPETRNIPVVNVKDSNHDFNGRTGYPFAKKIDLLETALEKVNLAVENALNEHHFPVIFSGDHSNAIGSISGLKNCLGQDALGVIWIDAHFDLHSPFTTPSGNIHGMALNALIADDNVAETRNHPDPETLEYWNKLKHLGSRNISPKVNPAHVVYIGVRDFEPEEQALARRLGIRVYTVNDVRKQGMEHILQATLEHLQGCQCLYVSFDVDSLDTSISRATGTPVDNGLFENEAAVIFQHLFRNDKVAAFEITEINPELEDGNRMAETVAQLLKSAL